LDLIEGATGLLYRAD